MGWLSKAWKGLRKLSNFLGLGIPNMIDKALKRWLTPDLPDKEALKVQRQGSDQFIPVVYGTREVGAIVVDRNVTDQAGGAENEFLHLMCVFCHGEIDAFEEFYFNDVSWNDEKWLKDKNNPSKGKWFTYELRTGAVGQTAVNAVGKLNGFSETTSKYEGLAIAFFTIQIDKDQTVWNGGAPQIKARIRGKKCFDPRTGLTAYTENPAIHLIDYLSSNIYSLGLTSEDYDIQSFIDVANIADIVHTATIDSRTCKTVDGVYSCTGSPSEVVNFKRYSHNNIIDTQQTIFKNIQEIANSFRGYFPNSDGRLSVKSEMEGASVFSFNADNMVSSITSEVPDRNSRFNRVVVRFPNHVNRYEMDECFFPESGSQTEIDWLAEDNGITQEKSITAEYTVFKAEALQLARIAAYDSRYSETITFTATPEANAIDVGDIVDVSDETRGWSAKEFRVSEIQYRDDGLVNITGVQHQNEIYPWLGMSYTDIIGGSNLGDPSNIQAPFGLTIAPDETFATAGLLSWESANNAFIRRFVINVISGEDVIYSTESLANNWPIPLFSAGDYSIQVRAMSTIGSLSPAATIAFSLTASLPPTDIIFNASNFEIEAIPVLLGAGLGTQFDFALDDVSNIKGRGRSIVFTGLSFNTTYIVFARTINALGISDWFSKEVTTTADSSQIIDLIGDDIYESVFEPVVDDLQSKITANSDLIGGLELELNETNNNVNAIQEEVNLLGGAAITSIVTSVNKALNDNIASDKNTFYQQYELIKQKREALNIGEGVATVDRKTQAVSTDLQAVSQDVITLKSDFYQSSARIDASFVAITNEASARASAITDVEVSFGNQISAQSLLIQDVDAKADGTASSLAGLTTRVSNAEGDIAESQLILDSTVDELGQVSARAFLGTSTVVGGKAVVNGIVIDSAINAMEFRTNTFVLANNSGVPALYWDGNTGKFVFNGRLVIGGYSVNSEADIRALDGDTIYEIYQYSVNGTTNWHTTYATGDIFRRTATVTNGVTGSWSAAARITGLTGDQGPQGVAGQVGAGFYGSIYATMSWTTSIANARFLELVGRNPVNGDIFTQTLQTGTDSQARQYNGTSWVTVALQVNGSIVASGTIGGDKLIAGTSISAPVINGGTFVVQDAGATYFEVVRAIPFGPNSLVQWYGKKLEGVNWNSSTLSPIYSGMTKSNARTYKGADGSVFFGGTFAAGTLSNSQTNTTHTSTPATEITFNSNGGLLSLTASFSFGAITYGSTTGPYTCPTTPALSVVTGTLFLEEKINNIWQVVNQQSISGSYGCDNGEGSGEPGVPGNSWVATTDSGSVFTIVDNKGIAGVRNFRVRAILTNWFTTTQTSQSITIATSE